MSELCVPVVRLRASDVQFSQGPHVRVWVRWRSGLGSGRTRDFVGASELAEAGPLAYGRTTAGGSSSAPFEVRPWTSPSRPRAGDGSVQIVQPSGSVIEYVAEDLGAAVEFRKAEGALVDPLAVGGAGDVAAGALLALDPRDPGEVARFFGTFGDPPGISAEPEADDKIDAWWPSGLQWLPMTELRRLRGLVVEAARGGSELRPGWYSDEPVADPLGRVVAGVDGRPTLALNLWQAVGLSLGDAVREGRIGFCEAPAFRAPSAACGKPFIFQRSGRRRFCSVSCRSRANARLYHARRIGRDT